LDSYPLVFVSDRHQLRHKCKANFLRSATRTLRCLSAKHLLGRGPN